jgi:hypothetical protein
MNKLLYGATEKERHAAVRELIKYEWKANPVVASALLLGAKSDTSSAVRVDCIRHIAAHKITHPQIIIELGAMMEDSDMWVRDEAAKAISQLK